MIFHSAKCFETRRTNAAGQLNLIEQRNACMCQTLELHRIDNRDVARQPPYHASTSHHDGDGDMESRRLHPRGGGRASQLESSSMQG